VEREEALGRLAAAGGTVLVVGGADTGKSTFVARLASACRREGHRTAVVDCDVGQSDVGPPATVGLGFVSAPVEALSQVPPAELYFVGTNSPAGAWVELAVGSGAMVAAARRREAGAIIVDTCGLAQGVAGRRLKLAKAEVAHPDWIVCLQRRGELEPLARLLSRRTAAEVLRLAADPGVRSRSAEERRDTRRQRFARYFRDAATRCVALDEAPLTGSNLGLGPAAPRRRVEPLARGLDVDILHAATLDDDGLLLVVGGSPDNLDLRALERRCGRGRVKTCRAELFDRLLCGLWGRQRDGGRAGWLGLGIITAVRWRRGELDLFAPPLDGELEAIICGGLRVDPDGTELGRVPQGLL